MSINLQDGRVQTTVIAKVLVSNATEDMLAQFCSEVALVHELKGHPNIIKFCGHVTKQIPAMLLMEYCPNGSLREFLRSVSEPSWPWLHLRLTPIISRARPQLGRCRWCLVICCDMPMILPSEWRF